MHFNCIPALPFDQPMQSNAYTYVPQIKGFVSICFISDVALWNVVQFPIGMKLIDNVMSQLFTWFNMQSLNLI